MTSGFCEQNIKPVFTPSSLPMQLINTFLILLSFLIQFQLLLLPWIVWAKRPLNKTVGLDLLSEE